MKAKGYIALALLALTLASCGRKEDEGLQMLRFEQFLFSGGKGAEAKDFDSPLINYHADDELFMEAVSDFVNDPVVSDIYRITDSLYHNMDEEERQLEKALGRAEKLDGEIHYDRIFTLITADFENYRNRVFCNEDELAISIDHYAIGAMERYGYFGLPAYIVRMSTRDHIVPDCMAAIARERIVLPEGEMTLLDYAVAEGKVAYFVEQTLPNTPDSLVMRYSKGQMEWMKKNTANVWSWILQNRMLYTSDLSVIRNLIDDAPKTNAFGEDSAPRATSYIGWQIVRSYMKKENASLHDLFEETDSRKILDLSGWRP